MGFFGRIWDRISLFFRVDLPTWFSGLSLGRKILLFVPVVILAPILCYAVVAASAISFSLPVVFFMSWISGNETYEFVRPASEITHVEIFTVTEDIGLFSRSSSEIPEIVDQAGIPSIDLEQAQYSTFWTDFDDVRCREWWNDPSPSIEGGTILIQYADGSLELICAEGTFYSDAVSGKSGLTRYYFDREEFSAFLEKYGYPPS